VVFWSEHILIERIRKACRGTAEGLLTSIGDDCCEVKASGSFLISTDSLVDSIHFDRSFHPPHLLGRKSIAVNLSDIAAMGGRPRFVLLSLCLPENLEWDWLSSWLDGALEILHEYDCMLIGGDTVKSSELAFNVTVLGEPVDNKAIYRSGAEKGDTVWVSGSLGSAGAGLGLLSRNQSKPGFGDNPLFASFLEAHLNPVPRVALGMQLVRSGVVSSMQDISDGLATDLAHICKASGVSSLIYSERLPHGPELQTAADLLETKIENLLLRSGEDYQLLFTVKKGKENELLDSLEVKNQGITKIGEIRSGNGVFLQNKTEITEITFQGYEH
jgi:thiamine-monophosphate kinase